MRKIIAFLCIGILTVSCKNSNYENLTPIEKTKQNLIKNYTLFAKSCHKLDSLIQKTSDIKKAQNEFKTARLQYKRTESFISLYFPETSKSLNGAAIDKNDIHETSRKEEEEATGFQKVEELLEEMGKVSALLMLVKKMKFLFHLNLQKMHLMETRF